MYNSDENVRIDLDDRIWGIEGTYSGKEEVTGLGHDEKLYYIKYHPAVDLAQVSLWKRLLIKLGFDNYPVETTPEPIPESQFKKIPNPYGGEVAGAPSMKMVLMNDKDSESPWNEHINDSVGRDLQRVMNEKKKQERDNLMKEAEQFGKEHEGKLEKDKRRRKRQQSNNTDDNTQVRQNGN